MTDHTAQAFTATTIPRIFCIGRNYAKHIAELDNDGAQPCVMFMKPLSALVAPEQEVAIPVDQGPVHHEAELVIEIGRGGRHIDAEAARTHIGGIGLGLDLTLRGLQNELKSTGEPWEKCKAFDHSAPLGPMRPLDDATDLSALRFRLDVNGECRQQGDSGMMLAGVGELIARISAHWQLLPGDLIYTGTPEGVTVIKPGDTLTLSGDDLPGASWRVTAA